MSDDGYEYYLGYDLGFENGKRAGLLQSVRDIAAIRVAIETAFEKGRESGIARAD